MNGRIYGWYLAALLATAHLVSFVDRNVMAVVLEPLKAAHGLSDAALGLLQGTSFVVLYSVAAIPLGLAADRVSRRGLIAGGLIVWSIATAACGLAQSVGALFAARVLVGLGEAALVPAAMSLLAAEFPRGQLGRAVSLFTAGASLGKVVAFAGGGALLLWFSARGTVEPWRAVFVAMAVPGLILALAMLSVREPVREARVQASGLGAYLATHRATWMLHFGAAACIVLVLQSAAAWAPSLMGRHFGMTPAQAGLAIGGVLLFAAPLGHICGGVLTDWLQRRGSAAPAAPAMAIGLAGAIPCLWGFAASDVPGVSLFCFGAANFCLTLGSPAALAGVQMLAPERLRGQMTALLLAVTTMIGIGIGPPLVGWTSDLMGGPQHLGTAIASVLPLFAAAGVVLALSSRKALEKARATH